MRQFLLYKVNQIDYHKRGEEEDPGPFGHNDTDQGQLCMYVITVPKKPHLDYINYCCSSTVCTSFLLPFKKI